MSKHTKGEWKVEKSFDEDGFTLFTGDIDGIHTMIGEIYTDTGSNGMPEVRTIPSREESEANAKLIVASKDLLEALESLLLWNEKILDAHLQDDETIQMAKAAIQKATQ